MLSYTFSEAALEHAFRFILMRNGEQGTFSQESDMNIEGRPWSVKVAGCLPRHPLCLWL